MSMASVRGAGNGDRRKCDPSLKRGNIIDENAFPEGLAGGDKSGVILAFGLIELMVLEGLEVQ
jgi:hypothetical protein